MTEAEILRLIRRVSGISQQADEQTTQTIEATIAIIVTVGAFPPLVEKVHIWIIITVIKGM
ncbi:TPA: hypothetical protein PJM06_004897 [Escherichia coli]|nr:hypothetical protein [Escherichia coli]